MAADSPSGTPVAEPTVMRMRDWLASGGLASVIMACAPDQPPPHVFELCPGGASCGGDGPDTGDGGGSTGGTEGDGETGGVDTDSGGTGMDSGPEAAGGLPCAVRDALLANCGQCHADPPSFGAPMALSSFEDLMLPAVTDPARAVYEVVHERILDPDRPMPPDGQMGDADRQILVDWIEAGAPEDPAADCDMPDLPDPDPSGPEALPCEPDFTLTAHAAGSEQAYHVPARGADDLYQCFVFKSPFPEPTQATAWAPVIDDERVVHHWILYRNQEPQTDGSVVPCGVELQLSADFVAGWAPGGENMVMPADVGLELGGPDDWYILQVHYNNTAGHADALDKSGVSFCTAEQPRPQSAGILTLGTVGLNIPAGAQDHAETGTCGWLSTFSWPELHILGASPHMHELGRAFRTELDRGGGNVEVVTDVPVFDFSSQGMYLNEPEIVVKPGETLRTTCWYDNPHDYTVGFGEGTGDEMCFNFVLAYPIDQLPDRNCGIIF